MTVSFCGTNLVCVLTSKLSFGGANEGGCSMPWFWGELRGKGYGVEFARVGVAVVEHDGFAEDDDVLADLEVLGDDEGF